ncbi:hypothetical protein EDB81DRAFT_878826 [Dactylonectria macrodidyma]|uniref:Metallo-beta-lactamase domain-containing protein n=1 Tax=Dactylonectria macrodidyma TaxID=307937 RepID=A0A9P9FLU9_9HYPO|nr:hypothetical protein EDB81DRAFT_878826 [Dactylonectria macrodidyma]
MASYEDVIARFTDRSIPLSRDAAAQSIATALHRRINNACSKTEWAHHRMRIDKARVHNTSFGGRPPTSNRIYLDQTLCLDNIHDHAFDTAKWAKTIRSHAQDRIAQFKKEHPIPPKGPRVPVFKGEDPDLDTADSSFEDDPFLDGWNGPTKAGIELDLSEISDVATDVSETASFLELDIAAEAAGVVALGEVAVVLLPLLIPLFISVIFSSSASEFAAELAAADAQHEAMVRDLQEQIRKSQEDLAKRDAAVEEANKTDRRRRQRRKDDKKRKDDEEQGRKKREDQFYACVDRIMPLSFSDKAKNFMTPKNDGSVTSAEIEEEPDLSGYELRMSAIRQDENSPTFVGQIQEHEVGTDLMALLGMKVHVVTMYLHTLPAGISIGSWVEFELISGVTEVSNCHFIVQNENFADGVATIERFSAITPTLELSPRFFADSAWGWNTQVNIDTLRLAPDNVIMALNHSLNGFNPVSTAVHHGSRRLIRFAAPNVAMTTLSRGPTLDATNMDWNPKAKYLYVVNCGQGAAQFVLDADKSPIFALDCGYGRGTEAIITNLRNVLETAPKCNMFLSHWDKDHYGLTTSTVARDLGYQPEGRKWFAPNMVTGSLDAQLYAQIDRAGNLYTLNPKDGVFNAGNVNFHICEPVPGTSRGKNNKGAIAIAFGNDMSGYAMYPGDANYECIRGVEQYDGKIVIMVATHHGSKASIAHGSSIGAHIPKAMTKSNPGYYLGDPAEGVKKGSVCLFSYGQGNSYGHSTATVSMYYQNQAKYTKLETTVDRDGEGTEWHSGILVGLVGDSDNAQQDVLDDLSQDQQTQSLGASFPAVQAAHDLPGKPGSFRFPPACADNVCIGAGLTSLDKYAVMDSHGMVLEYRVVAQHLTVNAPLQVKCKADFSIPVVFQCANLEIVFPSGFSSQSPSPLAEVDVANGDAWSAPAITMTKGENGNDAYHGAYFDIRVYQNWKIRTGDTVLFDSTASKDVQNTGSIPLVFRYLNGRGGDGQEGGRGRKGADDKNGTDDQDSGVKGKPAFPGAAGGPGSIGGDAGGPSPLLPSKVTGLRSKLQMVNGGNKTDAVVVQLDTAGFGGAGAPGKGGEGGPGGVGGIEGVRIVNGEIVSRNRQMAHGYKGPSGSNGGAWAGVMPDYSKFAPVLKLCGTDQELGAAFYSQT